MITLYGARNWIQAWANNMETDISLGEQYHNIALMMFTSQRLYDIIIVFSKYYAKHCSLFKINFEGHLSFSGATDIPVFNIW